MPPKVERCAHSRSLSSAIRRRSSASTCSRGVAAGVASGVYSVGAADRDDARCNEMRSGGTSVGGRGGSSANLAGDGAPGAAAGMPTSLNTDGAPDRSGACVGA
eukprot:scaffold324447_cov61-Tisochrysis_lutea.AAC.5